ncbi:MAG TPA: hypothetical protein VMS64_01780 [Candidatus Methylomirabilis sp.]|nr:hypothetical protein [Candidatus Methylomirabilis sp.]
MIVTAALGEAWRSLGFVQLFMFTVLALLLIPLQLRFRALGFVLITLYLDAVAVSLTAAGYRRLRWLFLAGCVLVLGLKIVMVSVPDVATPLYVTSRTLVVVLLGGCVAAILGYVLRSAAVSSEAHVTEPRHFARQGDAHGKDRERKLGEGQEAVFGKRYDHRYRAMAS